MQLSFYLAIKQLGGETLTLRANELHLGKGGESLADTAKILSTYGNGFMLRTTSDKKIEEFSKHLTIPVINGLSPSSHPTQVLSDVFTVSANIGGICALSLPIGNDKEGLPIGLQLLGQSFNEDKLFNLGNYIENNIK